MRIAVVTFDGFNEIDSFVVSHVLNRVSRAGWKAEGNVATAGGCLSAPLLATWVIWRLLGRDAARDALSSVAPVGERDTFVTDALAQVQPHVQPRAVAG